MWEEKIEQEAISNPVLASQSARNIALVKPICSMICWKLCINCSLPLAPLIAVSLGCLRFTLQQKLNCAGCEEVFSPTSTRDI